MTCKILKCYFINKQLTLWYESVFIQSPLQAIKNFYERYFLDDYYKHRMYNDWSRAFLKEQTLRAWVKKKNQRQRPEDKPILKLELRKREQFVLVQMYLDNNKAKLIFKLLL